MQPNRRAYRRFRRDRATPRGTGETPCTNPWTHAATPEPDAAVEAAVAGRLGGTRDSVAVALGPPVAEDVVNGGRYAVDGYGLVLVSYRQTTDTALPDDIAAVIVLRAPRPETVPATTPHPSDWSLREARHAAETFLPRDVDLGDPAPGAETGRFALPCASPALAALSPPATSRATPGDCTVTFLSPDEASVSFVTLALGDASADGAPPDLCAGMPAWAATVSGHLATAHAAPDAVASVSDDDPEAAATLDEIAATFATLAADQAATAAPPAAIAANAGLVRAFAAYADAVALAATGLAADDQALLADAAIAVEIARAGYLEAGALIVAAIDGCEPGA